MSSIPTAKPVTRVPVLFLKTRSTPTDAYEDLFSQQPLEGQFLEPRFVPVLRHTFKDDGMSKVEAALREERINNTPEGSYGGMIFTSQRAVEAFAALVERGRDPTWPRLRDVPIYSVGPATTRALRATPHGSRLQVFGEHTGTGEALAAFMLDHYREWYKDRATLPPLLFLVGEQRRDVIPRTLMDEKLPEDRRIRVDEVEVYGTGVMESFPVDLERALEELRTRPVLWVIVFSPTGSEAMLKGTGFLDEAGKVRAGDEGRPREGPQILVATIGPTTRDWLNGFGFTPHVCAERPSPEGVLSGIALYMKALSEA
ncbi:related to uroporphyrinogen III synthase [Cephalotrichum gorgonifer]|uniref:Related to uroporphyrinogen III synthase n=1 Tax=Cephalotrichum gorgonifer TaxID=2041049 RepID=A0AAE8SU46_9PEZI|nr:related to uroporphyrinogen III synthase [Cephalotrichum gorgonifer]